MPDLYAQLTPKRPAAIAPNMPPPIISAQNANIFSRFQVFIHYAIHTDLHLGCILAIG